MIRNRVSKNYFHIGICMSYIALSMASITAEQQPAVSATIAAKQLRGHDTIDFAALTSALESSGKEAEMTVPVPGKTEIFFRRVAVWLLMKLMACFERFKTTARMLISTK